MFDADCPGCQRRVLLGPRRILALGHDGDGVVATFRCWCGAVGRTRFGPRSRARAA